MEVTIKISGGFAGFQQKLGPIHTNQFEEKDAGRIRECVETLIEQTMQRKEDPIGADMQKYEIEVKNDDGRTSNLVLTDEDGLEDPSLVTLMEIIGYGG